MIIDEEDYLEHYGILRRSGRYPWGSGGPEYASNRGFLGMVKDLQRQGLSEVEIARGLGISTKELRDAKTIARNETKQADIAMAQRLKEKGMSNVAIGERMGINESSVRALLVPSQKHKADVLEATTGFLKDQVDKKDYLDVGIGAEHYVSNVGVSKEKLGVAVSRLQDDGYTLHYVKVPQLGTGQMTTMKVLAKPGVTYGEVYRNRDKIKSIAGFSDDGGLSFTSIQPPLSISSKRVKVRYAEEGGADADGVIYIRPGVKDLSLDGSRYAQVRVAVDGTHYLKGMAMYKDDLPPGVDIMFNTNKSSTGNKLDAMKKMSSDPDSPFGAMISRQIVDPKTRKVTSAMNIVNEEGTWETWSRNLSSQFLSKQSSPLAKSQLDMVYDRKKREFEEIMSLTNPSVKKRLLESFADDADSSAVHLKAAALPRQATHVILPINSLKETEIYAPNYRNGERVVLVRHPHGGIFEIPELTVNNKNPEAKKLLGNAPDAVGIHSKVAQRLSGADFDGDTVLVIPNNHGKVKTAPALDKLKGFDPQAAYKLPADAPKMSARTKGIQMGLVSNLITDMTIKGANLDEIARAVRHSMVVIDAEKHHLNYKQSAIDNGIAQLMKDYQGRASGGASTLISRAGSEDRVPERKQGYRVDPITGRKIYVETGNSYIDPVTGKTVIKTTKVKKLAETEDATSLSSGTRIEKIYADHSNKLKNLGNEARKAAVSTKTRPASSSSRTAYSKEVASLDAKLNIALRNAPLERQAQVLANAIVKQKKDANPDLEPSDIKKISGQALAVARDRTGAKKQRIDITDEEWKAIQADAISPSKLSKILDNADLDHVKKLATPKDSLVMTTAKQQRALSMLASGYTQAEVADALGVSLTTLKNSL